ncbi:Glutathione peroxidase [Nitrospira sp. KM1]|uniref:glutathione peroxidase n=1 Tax=Nitrospira sp. KM1 TaxID=1936990 RepID=UPI0013A7A7AA|nr:glutathione peroxidase [Nitrospira sp. KM1]BCA56382.1 Glutathione peroxidase [Nitrospira sp. KM1]
MRFEAVVTVLALGIGLLTGLPEGHAAEEGLLMAAKTTSLYDFTMEDIDGKPVNLGQYKGKVLLVVNTASFCGNTPQYTDLETIYEQYHERGFEVLAFPANNFGQQEPGTNAEIKGFCLTKYSVSFPLFGKISVKGSDKHPLYQYLTEQTAFPGEVEWNFQKYLVDRSGNVVARFAHRTKPLSPEVVKEVERVLAEK